MIKTLTCIECPKGCSLRIDVENCKVIKVEGHQCPKGEKYAAAEIENPVRVLTATVLAKNLPLKMIPVRTDGPIPRARMLEAAAAARKIRVERPVNIGDVIAGNFLGLGVNLISTRSVDCGIISDNI